MQIKQILNCNFLFLKRKIAASDKNAVAMESAALIEFCSGIISPETFDPAGTNKNATHIIAANKR